MADKILKQGTHAHATWILYQGKKCVFIQVQPTETKTKTVTEKRRGTIEDTRKEFRPIQEEGESRQKYQGRCNYAKKLVKQNDGKAPDEWPEGWKVEEVEVIEKRRGMIDHKSKKQVRTNKGKAVNVDLYHVPSVAQINTIVTNILKS